MRERINVLAFVLLVLVLGSLAYLGIKSGDRGYIPKTEPQLDEQHYERNSVTLCDESYEKVSSETLWPRLSHYAFQENWKGKARLYTKEGKVAVFIYFDEYDAQNRVQYANQFFVTSKLKSLLPASVKEKLSYIESNNWGTTPNKHELHFIDVSAGGDKSGLHLHLVHLEEVRQRQAIAAVFIQGGKIVCSKTLYTDPLDLVE